MGSQFPTVGMTHGRRRQQQGAHNAPRAVQVQRQIPRHDQPGGKAGDLGENQAEDHPQQNRFIVHTASPPAAPGP